MPFTAARAPARGTRRIAVGCALTTLLCLLGVVPRAEAILDRGHTDLIVDPGSVIPGYEVGMFARGLSEDGRYALFQTAVPYFVADLRDTNGYGVDVVRRDMVTGEYQVVSVSAGGYRTGDNGSGGSVMSADGRFVAFSSDATDLDARAQDDPGGRGVFLRDMLRGTTRLVSRAAGAERPGNNISQRPVLTPDGRYIVFESVASDLVAGMSTAGVQLFRYDRLSDAVELVSAAASGSAAGERGAEHASVSDDGRFVAFTSMATNLVVGADRTPTTDVFLRDMATRVTVLVSHRVGVLGDAASGDVPDLSADGSTVVFESYATTALTGPVTSDEGPGAWRFTDVFAFDVATSMVELLSEAAARGGARNGSSHRPVVSGDGREVAFTSAATNLVDGYTDVNNPPPGSVAPIDYMSEEVLVRHRATSTTQLLTRAATGATTANRGGANVAISIDGSLVTFESDATDLVADLTDTNGFESDVFAYSVPKNEMRAVSIDEDSPSATLRAASYDAAPSANGRFVAFALTYDQRFTHAARRTMEPPLPPRPPEYNSIARPGVLVPRPSPYGATTGSATLPSQPGASRSPGGSGYWMLGGDGAVYAFGLAAQLGTAPVGSARAVDIEATPSDDGYWVVDDQGRVFALGSARWFGNAGSLGAGEHVTSLSRTSTGRGYWLFTTTGRALTFGDAVNHGDLAGRPLNAPVLDSVPTASGNGYFMVAADGGIFAFGDARFVGSMGGRTLNKAVESLVPDVDGLGYWLVASDGGVFAFDAPFRGSMGGATLNRPITGMVPSGAGYLMVAADGGIFNFGDQPFRGSLGSAPPTVPIGAIAATVA